MVWISGESFCPVSVSDLTLQSNPMTSSSHTTQVQCARDERPNFGSLSHVPANHRRTVCVIDDYCTIKRTFGADFLSQVE